MGSKIQGIIFEMTSAFGGKYPDVPLAEGVEHDVLTAGDSDPFFITLPIGKVTVSRNDRVYRREAVESIKEAVVSRRVGGILGHLRDEQRAYDFKIPVIHWVGAVFEGDTLWAKGYIPPNQVDLRNYMRVAMASKSQVGTSIYGTAEIEDDGRVTNLWVETIDIAHPDRLGIEAAAFIPLVTGETMAEPVKEGEEFRFRIRRGLYAKVTDRPDWDEIIARMADQLTMTMGQVYDLINSSDPIPDEQLKVLATVLNIPLEELRLLAAINPDPNSESSESEESSNGESNMGDEKKPTGEAAPTAADPIAELQNLHRDAIREMQVKLEAAERASRDFTKVKSMLGIAETEDPILKVMGVNSELTTLRKENGDLLEATIKAEVAAKVAVETVRPVVEQMVRDLKPARRVDVTTNLEAVMNREDIKTLLKFGVTETMGGDQTRPIAPAAQTNPATSIAIPGA